jgi:hypothetical protein
LSCHEFERAGIALAGVCDAVASFELIPVVNQSARKPFFTGIGGLFEPSRTSTVWRIRLTQF